MWLGLLILWGGVTVFSVQGEKITRTCEARAQNLSVTCNFEIGSNNDIILEAKGDIGEGCMFKYTSSYETLSCCYIQYPVSKDSNLCNPTWNDEKCRDNKTHVVVEQRISHLANKCVLHLYNVDFSDAGEYRAVFPSDRNHNQLFHLRSSGMGGAGIAAVTVGVIVLILLACGLYRFFGPWTKTVDWWRRKTRREEPSLTLDDMKDNKDPLLNQTKEVSNVKKSEVPKAAQAPVEVVPSTREYCTTCSTQPWVAASQCEECNKYMCETCKESHGNSETTRGHQVKVLTVQCDCKDTLTMRVGRWRNSVNKHRKYFECAKRKGEGNCGYFKWAEGPLSPDIVKQRDQHG